MKNINRKNRQNSKKIPQNFYYIWHYLEWGGAQVLFFGLMKEAQKLGAVKAIMPDGSNSHLLKFLDNLKVPYEFFPSHTDANSAHSLKRKIERHLNKIYCSYTLIKHLRKIDFSNGLIHTELAPWQELLTLLWMCRKTTVFVTMHNSLPPVPGWRRVLWKLKFWLLTRSKNFNLFAANNDAKNSLREFVSPDFIESVRVTYANVNREEIAEAVNFDLNRKEFLNKYKLPDNKFLVFCVGQFIDRKGRWIFLEAAQKLLEKYQDIAFVWISNSRPTEEEFERVRTYNLGDNFIFLSSDQVGSKHVDLFKLLRLADVFALPSYLEGLPISIIEAMALGIPTISTNINAIPEAIIHLETGILIEPGDSEALLTAIQNLKTDENLRMKIALNGRKYALEKFDESEVAKIAVEGYIEAYGRK